MVNEREIFGGKELMDFFCKDSVEDDKEHLPIGGSGDYTDSR